MRNGTREAHDDSETTDAVSCSPSPCSAARRGADRGTLIRHRCAPPGGPAPPAVAVACSLPPGARW
jgi:hypothetical protein